MRIAVAMSGGVDSSVAALLLARQGANVVGLSMHLWDHDRDGTGAGEGRCCTLDDLNVARRAAEKIGVPHYVLNLEERFTEAVVKPFVTSYLEGVTPIPCSVCNTEVKFKTLLERAAALGCEAVATGHYARLEVGPNGETRLLRAKDLWKDQTYFLYDLTSEQLSRARFPVGDLTKSEVRVLAREAGLPNWDKPDSQEVCFVPAADGPAGFIRNEAESLGIPLPSAPGARPGEITDAKGSVLGSHAGTFPFTVGQRRGLGLSSKEPLYVLEVQPREARVVVGPKESLLAETDHELSRGSRAHAAHAARDRRCAPRVEEERRAWPERPGSVLGRGALCAPDFVGRLLRDLEEVHAGFEALLRCVLDERSLAGRLEVVGDPVHEPHEPLHLARLSSSHRLHVKVAAIAQLHAEQLHQLEHLLHGPHRAPRDAARDEEPVAPSPPVGAHEDLGEPRGIEGVARKVALRAHRAVVARVLACVREEDPEDAPVPDARHDEVADVDRIQDAALPLPVHVLPERAVTGSL